MSSTSSSNTAPAPTVWPVLGYADAPALIEFLAKAFGLEEVLTVPGETEGEIMHAELAWPCGGGVMLSSLSAGKDHPERPAGASSLYAVTDDPDGLFARATAAGAEVVRPIRDEDYGNRSFIVRDPEGNLWSFGYYRGQPRPAS
ncbi:VOC family protein [Allosalinactinospora lopnorensis]|uniref:VOC family protein n=1 Tax=Allosalinactinospora lopnorensis TaxID=1352348 RepID=UPI000623ED4E|nr:VOC family protein [Allosalinactinospora lopnorensis]